MVSDEVEIPNYREIAEFFWQRGDLRYLLWPQQESIYSNIRALPKFQENIVVLCSRQYGKSFLGVLMAVEDCLKFPGYSIPVVGPTIKQTVDIVNQAMRKIEAKDPMGVIKRSKSESRWYIGESELIVGGFDVKTASRQRGKTALRIYVEEVMDSNPDDYREALRSDLGPMLTHSPEPQVIFLTTPPRIPDHPFITETIPAAKLANSFYEYTIDHNEMLSPEQYDACVRRCGGKDTVEFLREYMVKIVRDTSIVVISSFDKKLDVTDKIGDQFDYYQVVTDWGGTRDKTVSLLMAYDYASDTDFVLDEMVWPANTPTAIIAPKLFELERMHRARNVQRFADVQQVGPDLIQTHGYNFSNVPKGDWQAAINKLNVRFAQRKMKVHPRCKLLVQTLDSGIFNKQRTDFERTEALGHCDALAALMYGNQTMERRNPDPAHPDQYVFNNQFSSRALRPEMSGMLNIAKAINPHSNRWKR